MCTLTADLTHLAKYCKLWCLKPSMSHHELNVHVNGQRLKHNPYPVYLGVTTDQTLSYREHLSHSAAKLKSRNNLITKLAHTSYLEYGVPAQAPATHQYATQSQTTAVQCGPDPAT